MQEGRKGNKVGLGEENDADRSGNSSGALAPGKGRGMTITYKSLVEDE